MISEDLKGRSDQSNVPVRIDALLRALFAEWERREFRELRWQLVHGCAAPLIEAGYLGVAPLRRTPWPGLVAQHGLGGPPGDAHRGVLLAGARGAQLGHRATPSSDASLSVSST